MDGSRARDPFAEFCRGQSVPDPELLAAYFAEDAGYQAIIPNSAGLVLTCHEGDVLPRLYVTGWIKRGPSGVIGSNKRCARETVQALLGDVAAGAVTAAPHRAGLRALFSQRKPDALSDEGWSRIDTAERLAGQRAGRPRVKFTDRQQLMFSAKGKR